MMRIKRNHASSKDFWVTCGFECLRVGGVNDTTDGNNTYTGATPFRVSDMWGLYLKIYLSAVTTTIPAAARFRSTTIPHGLRNHVLTTL